VELKPGYKRTEVGVIPENWKCVILGAVAEVTMGQSPVGNSYNKTGLGLPLINGPTEFTEKHPIRIQWTTEPNKVCKTGDLLLCVRGSSTGRMNVADEEYCIGRGVAAIRARPGSETSFLTYQIAQGIQRLLALSAGSTFPNVDGKAIRSIRLPLPPVLEQRAITGAIEDMDALLAALEELITKKRDLRQAAMQQLLTGRIRLPGFSGVWEVKGLGSVGGFSKGKGIRKDDVIAEGLPCIRYGEIYTHHNDYIRDFLSFIPLDVAKRSRRLRKGDLLFAGSGETAEEIGKCVAFLDDTEAYAGSDIVILSPTGHNSMYLGYLMNHPSIARQKARMGQGDAVVHISARNLAQISVRLPEEPEQTAIATVLSDIDAELAALERRLAKTRALKQGVMQELLIGRTRLV
jgi:type I restriction enzyme S subunit